MNRLLLLFLIVIQLQASAQEVVGYDYSGTALPIDVEYLRFYQNNVLVLDDSLCRYMPDSVRTLKAAYYKVAFRYTDFDSAKMQYRLVIPEYTRRDKSSGLYDAITGDKILVRTPRPGPMINDGHFEFRKVYEGCVSSLYPNKIFDLIEMVAVGDGTEPFTMTRGEVITDSSCISQSFQLASPEMLRKMPHNCLTEFEHDNPDTYIYTREDIVNMPR